MSMRIELQSIEAVLKGLVLPDAPMLDEARITAAQSSLSQDPFKLTTAKPAKAVVLVSQASLAAFLEKKKPGGLSGFQVEVGGGVIRVQAKARVIIEIPVKAECTLDIVGGTELHVRLKSVDVAGGPAKALVESAINKQNPILKTSELPFPLTMTSAVLDGGYVRIEGEALPPQS